MQERNKKRIFIALGISERLKEKIETWRKHRPDLPVRWILNKNLHITLIPPWYSEDVEGVIEKLRSRNIGVKPFTVLFKRITLGPDPKHPRLIWVEGESSEEIVLLKTLLENLLQKRKEKRDFSPHLTLARFGSKDFPSFPEKKLYENISWKEGFYSFLVMESHLKRSGAEYRMLASVPFKRK